MFMCTSSSAADQSNRPASISSRICVQAGFDGFEFAGIEYADALQHRRVRDRTFDIRVCQALVETDRSGEHLYELVGGFVESPAPHAGVFFTH